MDAGLTVCTLLRYARLWSEVLGGADDQTTVVSEVAR